MLINVYSTLHQVPDLTFSHTLVNRRDRTDPELLPHLDGFQGYVMSRGSGEMTAERYHVLQHIQRVWNHLSLEVEDSALDEFAGWAWEANALCFLTDGNVCDPAGQVLISADGSPSAPEATVPYPEDAWERKQRTDRELAGQGITVPSGLPPVLGIGETLLRTPDEVARRAQALCLAAVRAESMAQNNPLSHSLLQEKIPVGWAALSPREREFVENDAPSQHDTVQFSWGYEALYVLQWALSQTEVLSDPTGICNVPEVAQRARVNATPEKVAAEMLRPVSELLEALDRHYRLHWAVRQALQVEKKPAPAGLEAGVIMERHRALNWLTRFYDADWDEIDTPT
jgi:hypothetical protein